MQKRPEGDSRCSAKSKGTGEQCRQYVKPGSTKCHYHGGASPKGPGAGRPIIHGMTSKFPLPEIMKLTSEFGNAVADPNMQEEIKAQRAVMDRFMGKWGVERITGEPDLLAAWLQMLVTLAKLISEQKKPVPVVEALSVTVEDTGYLEIVAKAIWETGEHYGIGGAELVASVETCIRRILRAVARNAGNSSEELPPELPALPPARGAAPRSGKRAGGGKPKRARSRKPRGAEAATDGGERVGAGTASDPRVDQE